MSSAPSVFEPTVRRARGLGPLLLAALGASVALAAACGNDSALKGVNGACTRSSDCQDGLSCVSGQCEPPDAGLPADGGTDSSHPGLDGSSAG